jgi:hypothetical protein
MAIAYVKELGGVATSDLGGISGDVTFQVTGAAALGNTVLVMTAAALGKTISVLDQRGNTWTQLAAVTNGGGQRLQLWASKLTTALQAGDTMTLRPTDGSPLQVVGRAVEFSGLAASGTLDVSASAIGSNNTSTSVNLPGTTGAERLLLGVLASRRFSASSGDATASPGSGYTGLASAGTSAAQGGTWYAEQLFLEYRIVGAQGAYSAGFSYNPAGGGGGGPGMMWDWLLLGAALRPTLAGSAPTAPSGLGATAVSSSEIDLTWTDNSGDEIGFQIERSADGSTGWEQIAQVEAGSTSYANTGLAPSTTYYYRVRACNANGSSNYTSVANATTLASDGASAVQGACGAPVEICCPSDWYADVADVQDRIDTAIWTAGAASQPAQATVETLLQSASRWVDATLAWRYVVPITQDCDLVLLRPIVADLVAAQLYEILSASRPDLLDQGRAMRARALTGLVYHPGGLGTWLSGGSAVVVGRELGSMGRSYLTLPSSTLADTGEAALGQPLTTLTDPDAEDGVPRLFAIDQAW